MISIFPSARTITGRIAAAVLASLFLLAGASAQAQAPATGENLGPPQVGTREYTDEAAGNLKRALDNADYQREHGGTKEAQDFADEQAKNAYYKYEYAVRNEAATARDVREANEWRQHHQRTLDRLKKDPNTGASDIAKAEKDVAEAQAKEFKLTEKQQRKIEKQHPEVNRPLKPDDKSAEKSKEKPPDSSKDEKGAAAPLDFLGDVSIGVGVGAHGDDDRGKGHRGRCGHRGEKAKGSHKDSGKSSRGCGCGCGRGGSRHSDDDDDD